MAEAALFSLASGLLAKIASPAFVKAYERICSIRAASNELEKLRDTIETIHAKLLDAEKRREKSAQVKNWIERVGDVLYDADDLFDEVATDDLIKQQIKGGKHVKEVRIFLSKQNPIVSSDSVAKKVKAIRERLGNISNDMALFHFVSCTEDERPIRGLRRGEETGGFVDPNEVIGRDHDKEVVLDFLYDGSYVDRKISLISIVGIGGMGKSTLAQLVYNDGKVQSDFKNRYWACISDILDEKEVIRKIYQSLTNKQYDSLSLNQLQEGIRKFLNDKQGKFLLVLDDLWDEDHARGSKLWALLSSDAAEGSKIIISTRNSSVAKAYKADKTLVLKGLSSDASWELFRRIAFSDEQKNDPAWIRLGEMIVSKCVNVPLAIKTLASLLCVKDTMEEWKSFEAEELSKIEHSGNTIMSTLRLSYDHLPSHLKNCFAYCSLFPKDSMLDELNLIYLWIAQGYVTPKNNETLETTGHGYFMELVRRSFLEEETVDTNLNEFNLLDVQTKLVRSYKMHDLIHDLATDVAGEQSVILTTGIRQIPKKIRHFRSTYEADNPLVEANRLRSFFTDYECFPSSASLHQQVTEFAFLHALDLRSQTTVEVLPSSIGELKYLRYLNLSDNKFKCLPGSITKLVNLLTLDIGFCKHLEELPAKIGDLIHLRHLINRGCGKLCIMPPSFGELTSLQHLSIFRVSKSGGGVDALARLNLRGKLVITYDANGGWCKDDQMLAKSIRIPDTLEELDIYDCPMMRMPTWWTEDPASRLPRLESLILRRCNNVKHLPPLRCLPCLRSLHLNSCTELEYVEEGDQLSSSTGAPFFPCLRELVLWNCQKLEGWSRRVNEDHAIMFPFLSDLNIYICPLLLSMPRVPRLQILSLYKTRGELVPQLVPTCSSSSNSTPASSLKEITITDCENFTSFRAEGLTSLRKLKLVSCSFLTNITLAPNLVEEFIIDEGYYRCDCGTAFSRRNSLATHRVFCDALAQETVKVLTKLNGEQMNGGSNYSGALLTKFRYSLSIQSSGTVSTREKFWADKEEERIVDWDSFTNLRLLTMDELPEPEKLPNHLQQLVSAGKLKIKKDGFIHRREKELRGVEGAFEAVWKPRR